MLKKTSSGSSLQSLIGIGLTGFAILMLLLTAPALFAQSDTGNIAGTVTDATGAVIPNANVLAVNTENGLQLSAVSN
ncbi:MAG: carboxypeptidase-like regulatory domain-containing protein, partial [Terracidiphilus sp.]